MAHRTNNTVQQECFEIPKDFKTGYQALLAATKADWARGAVREIKCRLCPDAKFKKWGEFKRHCDAWRRTRSRFSSASIVGIISRAVTRANDTTKIGSPSVFE
jgi:hypothetical protein